MEKEYGVKNMHCAACKGNVESACKMVKGVKSVDVNLISNSAKIVFDDKLDEKELFKAVHNAGYELESDFDEDAVFETKKDYKRLIKIIIGFLLLVPLLFIGMGGMYSDIMPSFLKEPLWVGALIQFVITFIIVGLFFSYYKNGFLSIIRFKFNMDSLVFLGSFFSIVYSLYLTINSIVHPNLYPYEHFHLYLDGAAMVLVIVSLGKYIEDLSKNKAKSTIKALLDLRPKTAHLFKNNEIIEISTKNIKLNDVLIVKPGETIPCDGVVLSGKTSVDESIISGESLPIFKKEDDFVIGGSVNKEASIKVLVNKAKKENVLNKIASLVSEASNMKTPLTERVDKVAKIFVPTVIIIAIVVFISWLIAGYVNGGVIIEGMHFMNVFDEAFTFGVGVLVISCPCALGLATPISLLVGSSIFSKNYILVQKSEGIEKVKDVDTLVLDKTNTITEGELAISYSYFIKNIDQDLIDKIFTMESYSEHPIGKAITTYLNEKAKLSKDFLLNETIPGSGIKGEFNNNFNLYITSLVYAKTKINLDDSLNELFDERSEKGEIPILIYDENEVYGVYFLKDKLKKEAKRFIEIAKTMFKRIVLLTGDNQKIASYIAKEVGIDEVISEVKPEDKDKVIMKLQQEGHKVMMVGDGVNDSIALTRSDVGVAVAKGSDIALASASFILMRSNLSDIFRILFISKRIRHNISFNLFWAFIYNAVFIPVAAGAFALLGFVLSPMYCSMLMALSSVTVCLNALTLYLKKH